MIQLSFATNLVVYMPTTIMVSPQKKGCAAPHSEDEEERRGVTTSMISIIFLRYMSRMCLDNKITII